MRALICLLLLISPIVCAAEENISGEIVTDPAFQLISNELQRAISDANVSCLMKYVAPTGTYVIDEVYTHKQIKKMLINKKSWLYKHLFVGRESIRGYFERAENIRLKVFKRGTNAILISYQASNIAPTDWAECCLIKVNGTWYFDGIFSCE